MATEISSLSDIRQVRQLVEEDGVRVHPERRIFDGVDTTRGPEYLVGEMTKSFLGWSSQYIRKLEGQGVLDKARQHEGKRRYNLAEVEEVAYRLHDHKVIDPQHHHNILNALYFVARIWRII